MIGSNCIIDKIINDLLSFEYMMNKAILVFTILSLLLTPYLSVKQEVLAAHTVIFIPVLEMEPKSPIAGQQVKLTTVLTNKGSADMPNIKLSFSLDGEWIINDINVNVPAQRSTKVSFETVLSSTPGQHQIKACPDRQSLGDDGHHCQTLDFVAIDESTIVVTILSPKEEETLRGIATIKVAALGEDVNKVELYVENKLVDTKYQAPFDFTFDTTKYEDGKYKIYVFAYYDSGISKFSAIKKYFINNGGSVILTIIPGEVQESHASVGQTVIIESDIENEQPFRIAATFIVLVKNSNGFTDFLSWKEERISSNQTLPMSRSWTPEAAGTYTVNVFLWDTVESAVPLADVMRANIVVG